MSCLLNIWYITFLSFFPVRVTGAPLLRRSDPGFEVFFSQQSIINPCTGYPITFDFGYFKMQLTRNVDVVSGGILFQQTMRHDGKLYSQRNEGTFSANVPSTSKDYAPIIKYDVPDSPFNMVYIFDFELTSTAVTGVHLKEIQVGKC